MRKVMGQTVQGYVSSRVFRGNWVPQRAQNIIIRDYCKINQLNYQLSATEYAFEDSFVMLASILAVDNEIEGIVFYSMFQLPLVPELRRQIYSNAREQGKILYFSLEEKTLTSETHSFEIEEILCVNDHLFATLPLPNFQDILMRVDRP